MPGATVPGIFSFNSFYQMTGQQQYIIHIAALLAAEGLRLTNKRATLITAFYNLPDFKDAESFWLMLKAKGLQISRASVYRTLQLLADNGFAERRKDKPARYYLYKAIKACPG